MQWLSGPLILSYRHGTRKPFQGQKLRVPRFNYTDFPEEVPQGPSKDPGGISKELSS